MMTKRLNFLIRSRSLLGIICFLIGSVALAQERSISGKVVDGETGEGLPGVTIQEVGTSNGAITDVEGNFSLRVQAGAKLVINYVGFVSQTIEVGNQSQFSISLTPDVKALDEVVVVGYGTQKRSDLTGSVVSVTGDQLKKVPVATIAESLTGRLAGVSVTSTEGSPDAQINIRVRGGGSLTQDNTPLFIVDGFPVNTIADIAPSDIKSIDVLKDASSTAIYGSRGANGVIIITTKTGNTNGKLTVNFNSFYGSKKIANTLDVLDPEDYARWQYEYAVLRNPTGNITSYTNYFGAFSDLDLFSNMPANDWQNIIYGRVGHSISNDVNISGGTDRTNFSANYARFDEKAIMVGSSYLRNNFTFKLNNKPNDRIDLAFSLRYSDTRINGGGANEQNEVSSADSRLKHSVGYAPIPLPGLTSGADDTDAQIAGDLVNPLAATWDNDREQLRRNYNLGGAVTWRITDNLHLRSDVGADTYSVMDNRFYGLTTYFVANRPAADYQNQPAVVLRDRKEVRLRNTNTISYDFKEQLSKDHNLKVLVGNEILKTESQQLISEIHGFPAGFSSDQAFKLTTQGKGLFSVDNNFSPDDKLLSFFGRVNYDFKGRYLVSATYRADGSSKFLGDNQWGYFPSAAAAWKLSEENFMKGASGWLNSLKLRMSYGESGNNNIPVGQTFQAFESSTSTWINGFTSFWAASKTLANPDLKWETTVTQNFGLDFALFKSRVTGSLDIYQNNTTDLLIRFPVPGTGYDTQFRNLGETENRGVEAAIQYYAIDTEKYGLNFNFNISFNRNEIVSLGSLQDFGWASGWASTQIGTDFLVAAGRPVGLMQGYVSDGRYEVSDFDYNASSGTYTLKEGVPSASTIVGTIVPGMMKLKDLNEDGVVDVNDQRIIGNANPKHVGGLVINGYAYGFDMTAAFNWSYGNSIYNANKVEFTTSNLNNQYRNLITIQETGNRWTNIDPMTGNKVTEPNQLSALNENTTMWSPFMARYVFSDWAVEDGSFLRLNTLTFGYTLPSEMISKYRINSLRFYTTAYNVFMLTKYTGFDPEVSTRRQTSLTPGVDYSAYPRSRMIVFGLNLTF